jgi:putative addiction module component (TIGR02574 family)
MMQEAQELLKKALALPEKERADLAGSLIESLDDTVDQDADAAWQEEILRRLEEVQSGKAKTTSEWQVSRLSFIWKRNRNICRRWRGIGNEVPLPRSISRVHSIERSEPSANLPIAGQSTSRAAEDTLSINSRSSSCTQRSVLAPSFSRRPRAPASGLLGQPHMTGY